MLNRKSNIIWILAVASLLIGVTLFVMTGPVSAHKKRHSASDMQAFESAYMDVVKMGDSLFHGGGPQKDLGITLPKQVWPALCVIPLLQMSIHTSSLNFRNK